MSLRCGAPRDKGTDGPGVACTGRDGLSRKEVPGPAREPAAVWGRLQCRGVRGAAVRPLSLPRARGVGFPRGRHRDFEAERLCRGGRARFGRGQAGARPTPGGWTAPLQGARCSAGPTTTACPCLSFPIWLYELDEDPKRKEFLDDLFGFMQKRGTPVNRIPIMAKQVLDLYTLYRLVTDKGGLVEVINKKIWREITKGLNLPTSITSAAFTLRTQYMKYLYPYECEKQALSSPGELQAAIDSNRREGRRQTFGTALFNYSPTGTPTLLGSPKMSLPALSISTHSCSQISQVHTVKKDSALSAPVPGRIAIPVGLAGHHLVAAQAAAASQAAVLEQLREKLETGEPPEKKVALTAEEQQRLMQHALQHNLLAMASQFPMNIKISNRDDRQETALNLSTNGISSINMSIEINGVVYTGVLFARRPTAPPAPSGPGGGSAQSQPSPMPTPNPLLPAPSHSHTPASTSP
ncbi:AT-rich interactive domain-containing protein 3A isoform X2 [Struthio camelus]|uniref:AT-rich interactive domain-containing protein 3A isoform X2 n=1 Tax=Struthio camelus TaxID=8801 RepID=UPI003603E473